ncbi:MAG: amidase, partial [Gammaproteobacteria bacterium]|nr:amidase [Gammaproteobacteria bacterium]
KSNTPEFGAGAQTFNAVFGATGNPYDPALTCGGSSGGSAVALACGMSALADGSDFGGSLRAPAAWCNVVGMRPSPGRVPSVDGRLGWQGLSVEGPMARTVADLALLMSAIAGPDPRSPIALAEPGARFAQSLERDFRQVRVAFSHGHSQLPVDPEIVSIFESARPVLESLGCVVVDANPDFSGAPETYAVLRAARFALDREADLQRHRSQLKQTIIDNAEAGLRLSALDVMRAEERRTEIWRRLRAFMTQGDFEFLVTPVNPVPPFPVDQQTLMRIGDVELETYTDWGAFRYFISLMELPAISVPGGFTRAGLPTGLQIVGRPRADFEVMQLAHAFESATGFWQRHPPLLRN